MSDNPYIYGSNQNDKDYRLLAIFRCKDLKYLDYELIDDSTRELAAKKYSDQFNDSDAVADKKDEESKEADPLLVEAKIDCTHRMIDRLLENDPENSMKLKILQNFDQVWQNLEVEVTEKTEIYQKSVKDIHKIKKNCIEYCMKALKKEELMSEKKSIELIGKFQSYKKH